MDIKLLDTVVLVRDFPKYGLVLGDLGTVVELHEPDGLEVEFVSAAGRSVALLTLSLDDVRTATADDLLSVRPLARAAG